MNTWILTTAHLLCYANWIAAPVAAWQGRWWLALWCLFAAVVITVALFLYGAAREIQRRGENE